MTTAATRQYLERYACPEIAIAPMLSGRYDQVLVVPALGENQSILDEISPPQPHTTLTILVVNARASALPLYRQRNQQLLAYLAKERIQDTGSGHFLARGRSGHVLVVDRSTCPRQLPPKQGVGQARKIGLDIALALHSAGQIRSPWLHTTDADARLPRDYFSAAAQCTNAVALTYPFLHDTPPGELGRAHALYELKLRYYVHGLRQAGSPYAHHSLGSILGVDARAYAAVRGVPQRLAGEDFYLLDKLAKHGRVATPPGSAIRLRARSSRRTPFGTGPSVQDLRSTPLKLYHPASFHLLGVWLHCMRRASAGDPNACQGLPAPLAQVVDLASIAERIASARAQSSTPAQALRRITEWFNGLRTLQLVHALRDHGGLSEVPWQDAISHWRPFTQVDDALRWLRERDRIAAESS